MPRTSALAHARHCSEVAAVASRCHIGPIIKDSMAQNLVGIDKVFLRLLRCRTTHHRDHCENMMSSTKPEVHTVTYRNDTRARPSYGYIKHALYKNLVNFGLMVLEICELTDKQTYHNTSHPSRKENKSRHDSWKETAQPSVCDVRTERERVCMVVRTTGW